MKIKITTINKDKNKNKINVIKNSEIQKNSKKNYFARLNSLITYQQNSQPFAAAAVVADVEIVEVSHELEIKSA